MRQNRGDPWGAICAWAAFSFFATLVILNLVVRCSV